MRKEDLSAQLSELAFDFFYWFSRFEFALKANGYLKSHQPGAKAEPGWGEFIDKWSSDFVGSAESNTLLKSPPERQVVAEGNELAWRPVGLDDCKSGLAKNVRLLKTIRNNLFHGGKHGGAGWDDPRRTAELLKVGKLLLDQLAELAGFEHDYTQHY